MATVFNEIGTNTVCMCGTQSEFEYQIPRLANDIDKLSKQNLRLNRLTNELIDSANRLVGRMMEWTGKRASSTLRASQAVPHPSTDRALQRLTSEFGRDLVCSLRYGR